MKKSILFFLCFSFSIIASAQISVSKSAETICKSTGGKETLHRIVQDKDTTYFMLLYTYNQYAGFMSVKTGYKDETIALLKSMLEYVPNSKDEIINLNNEDRNYASYRNILGSEQFIIYGNKDAESRIGGYLQKKSIKKFLLALDKE